MECTFCFLGCRSADGKRVWELDKLEGASGCTGWPTSEVKWEDVPKPFLVFGGPETSPFSEPPTYWAHLAQSRRGEQIPQVSVIMRLMTGNVHGARLKPSELI